MSCSPLSPLQLQVRHNLCLRSVVLGWYMFASSSVFHHRKWRNIHPKHSRLWSCHLLANGIIKRLIKRKSLRIVSLWTLYNCACIFDINFLEKAEKKYFTWRCCTICRHSIPWFVLRVGVTFPTEQKNYSHRTTYWFRAFFFFFFVEKNGPKTCFTIFC